jgi:hypothetical protein
MESLPPNSAGVTRRTLTANRSHPVFMPAKYAKAPTACAKNQDNRIAMFPKMFLRHFACFAVNLPQADHFYE